MNIEPRVVPIPQTSRIASLDALRGVATLGMFSMSAVAYGLPHAAFFNLQSPGSNSAVDWVVAVVGEMLLDQKAVTLMAVLFGANLSGMVARVRATGSRARWPVLRRALVLFCLGVPVGMHGLLWEGTPLFFLALFTPLLLLLEGRSVRVLVGIGSGWILLSVLVAFVFHPVTAEDRSGLGQYWTTGAIDTNGFSGGFMPLGTFTLLLGALTIGLAVGRSGLLRADPYGKAMSRSIRFGLGVGLPLSLATTVWRWLGDYEPDVAIIAEAPNTLAVVPLALGYAGLVSRWTASGSQQWLLDRVRAVGQMALTNTALQTVFGIFVLRDYGFGRGYFSRSELLLVVLVVWAVQLAVSKWWLERFSHGPLEWVVRVVTYRRVRFEN